MKKLILAAPIVALGFASPAFAQAVSGPRVEARIGVDRLGVELDVVGGGPGERNDGIVFGGEVGFDAPIGDALTVGAYAGLEFSGAEICTEDEEEFEIDACLETNRNLTLGARVGFPIAGTSLVYLKAGYSNTKLKLDVEDDGDEDFVDFSDPLDGMHFGTGVEVGFNRNVYAKIEYVFTDYGAADRIVGDDEDDEFRLDADRHQVFLGVGFRF